jgi:hypothetical protein
VIGHIGRRQVDPESDPARQPLPLLRVAEDRLDAAARERLDAVTLDLGAPVDPQLLLDLDLEREILA